MSANDTVVITGISGRIAAANNVDEFEKYLYAGVDMIREDNRWPKDYFGLSNKIGKINDFSKFDADFFRINDDDANLIDPQIRVLIEVIFECIYDAGETLQTIRDSRTGIYYGSFYNEIDRNLRAEDSEYLKLRQTFLGWLSYALDIKGPSYMFETACSSSCTAIVEALNAFKHGLIDYAIIATSNTNYSPSYALVFQNLGLVSTDGKCRFLDANALGYVKSDAVTSFLLQRESKAKRIYGKILNAVTSADGYKKEGITFPKWSVQSETIKEAYRNAGIDPLDVDYVEAHGTGTQVGDAQEIKAIYEAFKVKDRKRPLLVGSVKTNVGHSEGSSGLTSILKVILTFKNKCIPQSLHFTSPNVDIEPLMKGEVVPVTSNTPFESNIIGVNSFGFGGSNVHLIIGAYRTGNEEHNIQIFDNQLSRLVLFCGRTEERVIEGLNSIEELHSSKQLTREYLFLINNYSKMTIESGMKSRGYAIFNSGEATKSSAKTICKRPLYIVFGGLGQQLKAMAAPFMRFHTFAESITKSAAIIDPLLNIDLIDILTNERNDADINQSIISLIPIAAFQIAMIDLFIYLGIKPDGYLGHSFGEFACAYWDGALTQEQYLLAAVAVYRCTSFKGLLNGLMVATDLSKEEFTSRQFENVYLACDNSEQSVTVAGNKDAVSVFIEELKRENRFVRLVNTGGIAFHCPVVNVFLDSISKEFKNIMNKYHTLTSKWISTSINNFSHRKIKEELLSSYFTRCVSGTVFFRDAVRHIPSDAVVVEISARKFMASILLRSLPSTVSVLNIYNESGIEKEKIVHRLLALFGSIYELGFNLNIEKLYPSVSRPFGCTTPSLSSIVKLDHSKSRLVRRYPDFFNSNSIDNYRIDLSNEKWSFLADHKVGGQIVMPISMYIYVIWDFASKQFHHDFNDIAIAFENINVNQQLILKKSKPTTLKLSFIEEYGKLKFAVRENTNLLMTAFVHIIDSIDYIYEKCDHCFDCEQNTDKIYTSLAEKGYEFGKHFKQIFHISNDFSAAKLKWMKNFVIFLESVFHLELFRNQSAEIIAVIHIECLQIDAKQFQENDYIHVHYDDINNEAFACTKTSQASLIIRKIVYESFNRTPLKQILPQLSDNGSLINYVCIYNTQNDISILGVSGRKANMEKFCGLIYTDRNTKMLKLEPCFTWNIDDDSIQEQESAATVFPYYAAYYSLMIRGQLKRGEDIIVLNAYTPIGIAAIAICLQLACHVSATVENSDEKVALKNYFPSLNINNIYALKSADYEKQIMKSNGNGYDLILNTKYDELLQSNLDLIAVNGRYLQFMSAAHHVNAILGLQIFLKNITVHGIQISSVLSISDSECQANLKMKKKLHEYVDDGIKCGDVRRLPALSSIFGEIINAQSLFKRTV